MSHFRNAFCHALGMQLKVWLVRKHPSHLGMQLFTKSCIHLRKFIILSTVAVLAVSLLRRQNGDGSES